MIYDSDGEMPPMIDSRAGTWAPWRRVYGCAALAAHHSPPRPLKRRVLPKGKMVGIWEPLRTQHRAIASIPLVLLALCGAAAVAAATPIEDCNSDIPAQIISGCSALLDGATDPKYRAAALVRRGEAYEKTGDLGAAVVDFIAAVENDPKNFHAHADLERLSPGGGPQTGPETPVWPRLVEGVAFPRGFEPILEVDRDRIGNNYHSFSPPSGDPKFCMAGCFADARCRAWGYVPFQKTVEQPPICTLKDQVPAASNVPGVASGVIRPEITALDCWRCASTTGWPKFAGTPHQISARGRSNLRSPLGRVIYIPERRPWEPAPSARFPGLPGVGVQSGLDFTLSSE